MKINPSMEEEVLRRTMLMRSRRFERYRDYGLAYPKFEDVLPKFRKALSGAGDLTLPDLEDLLEQFIDSVEHDINKKVDHLHRTEFRPFPLEGSAQA